MNEPKFEYGPFTFCEQNGGKGHCFNAQVFGPDGDSVAIIESTANESEATGLAKLFAAAPDLYEALEALKKQVVDLLIPAVQKLPPGIGVDFPTLIEWEKTVEKVDNAIAKARG